MLGYFWMAFFKDQFKANFYNKAFFNDAENTQNPLILSKTTQLIASDLAVQNMDDA